MKQKSKPVRMYEWEYEYEAIDSSLFVGAVKRGECTFAFSVHSLRDEKIDSVAE